MCMLGVCSTYILCCLISCFFFFKQKTAYEMRISDWSSDVCSSDLVNGKMIRPTSFDVAERAGVSQSTVSRALRNSPGVNAETRARVSAAARELDRKSVV